MKTKLIIAGMGPGYPAQVPQALLELVRRWIMSWCRRAAPGCGSAGGDQNRSKR